MRYLIIILLLAFITSCVSNEKPYKGLFTYGHEVNDFSPCNTNEVFWVSSDWGAIKMYEDYETNKTENYQAMYIEFRGQILNEKLDGFADETNGLMRISEIFRHSFTIPKDCQ